MSEEKELKGILDILFDPEDCLVVNRDLAKEMGLNKAMVYSFIKEEYTKHGIVYDLKEIESIIKPKALRSCIEVLTSEGYIDICEIETQTRRKLIKEDNYDRGNGDNICEWCGYNSFILHEHHYPIPKSKGGEETVSICPNCHYQYHHLKCQYIPLKIK